jgi:hypothetical protein
MDSAQNNLRDEIAAIVKAISDGDDDYWNGNGYFGVLDQEAVVNDIMAAVVEHDGEEVLEVFGAS